MNSQVKIFDKILSGKEIFYELFLTKFVFLINVKSSQNMFIEKKIRVNFTCQIERIFPQPFKSGQK